MIRMHFEVVVDDLDYHGHLKGKPQAFSVSAETEDKCWEMAEREAEIRSTDYGRVFEFTLTRTDT